MKKPNRIITTDECGNPVRFELPASAFKEKHMGRDYYFSMRTYDKLMDLFYKEDDRSDVLIHDLDDKIKVVELWRRKGVFI